MQVPPAAQGFAAAQGLQGEQGMVAAQGLHPIAGLQLGAQFGLQLAAEHGVAPAQGFIWVLDVEFVEADGLAF